MKTNKLITIKVVHTIIWLLFNVVIFTAFTLAYLGIFDILFWTCIFIVLIEAAVLLMNDMQCPLTIMARKYSKSDKPSFDIYLPELLAKYNKEFYIVLIFLAVISLIVKHLS